MGTEESTKEEVGCGGNEDVVGFRKLDRIRYKRIRGTPEVRKIFKKVDESDGNVVRREE